MITELTKDQESKLAVYRDKWIAIGLATDRVSVEEATKIIHDFQEYVLQTPKTPVILTDGPITAWDAVVKEYGSDGTKEKPSFVYPYQDGSFFASTFAYYDFWVNENIITISPELKKRLDVWMATSRLGLIYPLDKVCVVSQKPTKIFRNEKNQLHSETEKAVQYGDWGCYALNGVIVPEELVLTPAEKLDINFFKKEKNADVKAEFVRKYGVERMLDFGKKIDSFDKYDQKKQPWWYKSEYELWDMAKLFEGIPYQPYLKMRNQTTDIWHVEAVSPACRTLTDAIKERFGGREMKILDIA